MLYPVELRDPLTTGPTPAGNIVGRHRRLMRLRWATPDHPPVCRCGGIDLALRLPGGNAVYRAGEGRDLASVSRGRVFRNMIEVRSSPIHGRGAFATSAIRRGDMFHTAHLLVFDCEQSAALARTAAANYVFHVEDCPGDPSSDTTGIALSPISFVNHDATCNATFVVNSSALTVTFTALREIEAGEEITIDYGDFAGKLGID
jgi:uncharacterized protein